MFDYILDLCYTLRIEKRSRSLAKPSQPEEFLITNPEEQPHVVLSVEPGVKPVQLLEPYDSSSDVRCAFCAQRQVHKKGYLALLPDGRRALCGNVCAEEYFDKATVNSLDRKREKLARERIRKQNADAVLRNAEIAIPIIDDEIVPHEWEAEVPISEIGQFVPKQMREVLESNGVRGTRFLGETCRAFGDARGGIRAIAMKAHSASEKDLEKLIEKRNRILERMRHGTDYLREAKAFFQRDNLELFSTTMLEHRELHRVTSIKLRTYRIELTRVIETRSWMGIQSEKWHVKIPSSLDVPEIEEIIDRMGWS